MVDDTYKNITKGGRLLALLLPLMFIASLAVQGQNQSHKSDHFAPLEWYTYNNTFSENVYTQIIDLSLYGATLENALKEIAGQGNLRLSYDKKQLANHTVTFVQNNLTIIDAFEKILKGTDLEVLASPNGQVVIKKTEENTTRILEMQMEMITGTVTDARTGDAMPGVNIAVKGTARGTSTNSEGRYELEVPSLQDTLVFSFIGYQTREVPINGRTEISIALQPQTISGEEIVVVGYGTQKKEDLTGSISTVSSEQIENAGTISVNEALQGQAAGVYVRQTSAAPGGGLSIRIRGSGSINSGNEPLYVVDGIPIEGGNGIGQPHGAGLGLEGPNALSFLNPSDIESIDILKDASATAIYGARGSNGVVLITTKNGKPGQTNINFETSVGFQQPIKTYEVLNAEEFARFANEVAVNSGKQEIYADPSSLGKGTDFQDQIYRTAFTQNYLLSVNGGVENTQYMVSGGYTNENGVIEGSSFERFSLRANLNQQFSDQFEIGANLGVTRSLPTMGQSEGASEGRRAGAASSALQTYPMFPVRFDDGTYPFNDQNTPAELLNAGYSGGTVANPIASTREVEDDFQQERILGSVFGQYNFSPELSLKISGSVDALTANRNTYFPSITRRGFEVGGGNAIIGSNESNTYNWDNVLQYNSTIADIHSINATAGFTLQREEAFGTDMQNSNFVSDITGFNAIGSGNKSGGPNIGSWSSASTLASWIGRINYGYDSRYLITLTARADGSSKFGENNKWGFFPSGALAWRVSNEPFMKNADPVSNLKIRGSFGVTGNQEIGAFAALASLFPLNYNMDGQLLSGFAPGSIANPDLKWERAEQVDIGIDLGLFDNRLTIIADLYRKKTTDLLLGVPLPMNSGFDDALQNLGSIENKGFELSIGSRIIQQNNFIWQTDVNFSANRNEVLNLGEEEQLPVQQVLSGADTKASLVKVGLPIGIFQGFKTDGIFNSQTEIDAHRAQPNAVPGDRKIVDVNGDGEITADDRTIVGNPWPDYTFGWNNTVNFERFTLSLFLQGVIGADVFNANRMVLTDGGNDLSNNILTERFFDRWTPENPNAKWERVGTVPVGSTPPIGNNLQSHFVEDGSYLRAKNITLSYDIPLNNAGIFKKTVVYFGVQNAFTITGYSGLNPETNAEGQNNIEQGIDFGAYPLARTYRLGLKLSGF